MTYRIVAYHRTTERMAASFAVSPSVLAKIKNIAGFQPQDDGLGEYPLDPDQTRSVAKVLGFQPEPDKFFYYVEPYDPAEDSGFGSTGG